MARKNKESSIVAVAMSGGVDSSVAAFLLLKKYQVFGLTMLLGDFERQAVRDAKIICRRLRIPHYTVNLKNEFKKRIIQPFCREYLNGKTPNPCVWCNEKIKFGLLLKRARKLGADYLATGHYARVTREFSIPNSQFSKFVLKKAKDETRDQSYFLYRLKQNQLKRIIFPLGDLTKNEVKRIAAKNNLAIKGQKESREICFIPDNDYRNFLRKFFKKSAVKDSRLCDFCGIKNGPIKDLQSCILGEHRGLPFYTVGQRKGLLSGLNRPFYVIKIDKKNNALIVGREKDLYKKYFSIKDINWLNREKIKKDGKITVKIRYQHPDVLVKFSERILSAKELKAEFKRAQRAVTPGQSAVFYAGEEVLGGGIIVE